MNVNFLGNRGFIGFSVSTHVIGATTKWLLSISIVCVVSGCTLSSLTTDQLTPAVYVSANRWREAIEHWSQPDREHIFYRAGNETNCDLFVRKVFSDYGITIFREGNVDQLYLSLNDQWKRIKAHQAAQRAATGVPTVALTTSDDPPDRHIVVLLGGLDTRGYPNVRGAGAYSGSKGKPHRQRHGTYRGGVYDGLNWHWRSRYHKHIKYFSMPAGQVANAQ